MSGGQIWTQKLNRQFVHVTNVKSIDMLHQAPMHPWEWPSKPWSRIHIDYAGPLYGKMFLVCVDAHSKYLDVHVVNSATSTNTIEKLRTMFAIHGLPESIVSDNGTPFASQEFQDFVQRNGIKHIRSSPYQPSTNGLAERAVQTFKEGMKKVTEGSIETRMAKFLFTYRLTPHATTAIAPAEMLMGRRPRSLLDLTYPNINSRVQQKQQRQKQSHDKTAQVRNFNVGDSVYILSHNREAKWITGTLIKRTGPVSFVIELNDGRTVKRHQNQIRYKYDQYSDNRLPDISEIPDIPIPSVSNNQTDVEAVCDSNADSSDTNDNSKSVKKPSVATPKPTRTRKPPNRYGDFVYN
ncbi:unnamed protein product [Mytilus coruscus]|uniref:Integrase catalytic domain-containing protein n=1 Tax=Mytilus coruscus TaxID=42192 RepID=A0A6J8B3C7_MYTCO|nr:unnamed protein product [Mytilus coruscus]